MKTFVLSDKGDFGVKHNHKKRFWLNSERYLQHRGKQSINPIEILRKTIFTKY